ncbi:unnamed protein product [Amoebophrya sp. A120]|nr:unnamed protein product [Amoebophrya sp. A120]|eukprot:GSA120T00008323001.1
MVVRFLLRFFDLGPAGCGTLAAQQAILLFCAPAFGLDLEGSLSNGGAAHTSSQNAEPNASLLQESEIPGAPAHGDAGPSSASGELAATSRSGKDQDLLDVPVSPQVEHVALGQDAEFNFSSPSDEADTEGDESVIGAAHEAASMLAPAGGGREKTKSSERSSPSSFAAKTTGAAALATALGSGQLDVPSPQDGDHPPESTASSTRSLLEEASDVVADAERASFSSAPDGAMKTMGDDDPSLEPMKRELRGRMLQDLKREVMEEVRKELAGHDLLYRGEIERLSQENVALKARAESFEDETWRSFQRVRFGGTAVYHMLRFLLWVFIGTARSSQQITFVLLSFGYAFVLIGSAAPWYLVMFASVETRRRYFSRGQASTRSRGRSSDHLAKDHLRAGTEATRTQLQGSESESLLAIAREVSGGGGGGAGAGGEDGRIQRREQEQTLPLAKHAESEAGDKTDEEEDADDPLPNDFAKFGTLSCVCQRRDSAEGLVFTLSVVLYMVSSLLAVPSFEAYPAWCKWRDVDVLLQGNPGLPRMQNWKEVSARAVWHVFPIFCFVCVAVLPSTTDEDAKLRVARARLLTILHGVSAFVGTATLMIFESVQLFWGENVPLSYLFVIFNSRVPTNFNFWSTEAQDASSFGGQDLREPHAWHGGCIDYEAKPIPWNRWAYVRLVVLGVAWVLGLFFMSCGILLAVLDAPCAPAQVKDAGVRCLSILTLKVRLQTKKRLARTSFILEIIFMYSLFALPPLSAYSRLYDSTSGGFLRTSNNSCTNWVDEFLAPVTFHRLLDFVPPEKLYLRGETREEREKMTRLSYLDFAAWPAVAFETVTANTGPLLRIFAYQDLATELKLNPHNAKLLQQTFRPSKRPGKKPSLSTLVDRESTSIRDGEFAEKMAHFAKLEEIKRRNNNTGTYRDIDLDEVRFHYKRGFRMVNNSAWNTTRTTGAAPPAPTPGRESTS